MDFKEAIELMKKGKIVRNFGDGYLYTVRHGMFYVNSGDKNDNVFYLQLQFTITDFMHLVFHEYQEYEWVGVIIFSL